MTAMCAVIALAGTSVSSAGPGCMSSKYPMGAGPYPYSPVGAHPYPYPYYAQPAMQGIPAGQPPAPVYAPGMVFYPAATGHPGGYARPPASTYPQAQSAPMQQATTDVVTVRINGMRFEPAQISVKPGTTVTWVHDSGMPHTVKGNARGLQSGTMNSGQSYSFTFDELGSYQYACDLHPSMTGNVVVEAGGTGT